MKFLAKHKYVIAFLAFGILVKEARSQTIDIDFQNKEVSADGLSWKFDLAAKGAATGTLYDGPENDNWQAINIRLDFELPAGISIIGGSGSGNPANAMSQVGVQLGVPGNPSQGKTELGLTLARSAPPGQAGQQDINVNDFTTLATFTINFSGPVSQSTKFYPRLALNKEGSNWTNVADPKRRPISAGGSAGTSVVGITLPVKLVNFDAKKEGHSAQLSWSTSEEVNAAYFEVQKSVDGKNWNNVTRVNANGGEKQITNYEVADNVPFRGANLYRLRMVDLDGSDAYSAIRSLMFEVMPVIVYPNPVQNILTVKPPQDLKIKSIEIFDAVGRVVYKKGPDNAEAIDVSSYGQGTYIVRVLFDDGSHSRQEVVIAK